MDRAGLTKDTRHRMDLSDHIKSRHDSLGAHRENTFPRTLAFTYHVWKNLICGVMIVNILIIIFLKEDLLTRAAFI